MRVMIGLMVAAVLALGCRTGNAEEAKAAVAPKTSEQAAAKEPEHQLPLERVDLLELKNLRLEQEVMAARAQAIQAQLQQLQADFTQRGTAIQEYARGVITRKDPAAKPVNVRVDADAGLLRYDTK